jgi:putative ABC transport system permease protein
MFIAIRDIAFAKGRFVLMGFVVLLIAFLMTFLSGLSAGLVSNNVSGLIKVPATHFAFQYDDRPSFRGSLVERAMWEGWRGRPGVLAAEPLGHTTFNARGAKDEPIELVLWGVTPGSFLAPPIRSGTSLGPIANGAVISGLLADRGVKIGDKVTLDRVLTELVVVGITDERNFEHTPIVYVPLPKWQEATYGPPGGAPPGEKLPDAVFQYASAIALQLAPGADARAADKELGTTTLTREDSYGTSPAYTVEVFTVAAIQGFLIVVSVVLLGAFFAIWTIQRTAELGLVKALGASNAYLLRDSLGQALLLMAAGVGIGATLGVATGYAFKAATTGSGFPFILEPVKIASSTVLLLLAGVVGGAISIRLITRVDPIIALGRDR